MKDEDELHPLDGSRLRWFHVLLILLGTIVCGTGIVVVLYL